MRWHDLLFMHWPIDPATIAEKVPGALEIDTFGGSAWIGVVPFRMSSVRPRLVPELPWLSSFPELNVRTYVKRDGRPGVWFLSLDAAQKLAVRVARATFHLPYFHARMTCRERAGWIDYSSERLDPDAPPAAFAARYRPTGPPFLAKPGSLDHFLTARYCLYSQSPARRLFRAEIDHAPWPLQPAECHVDRNTLFAAHSLPTRTEPPILHSARRLDVAAWGLDPC
jgi:hypothetical protein